MTIRESRRPADFLRLAVWVLGLAAVLFSISNLYFFHALAEVRAEITRNRNYLKKYAEEEIIFKEIFEKLTRSALVNPPVKELLRRHGVDLDLQPASLETLTRPSKGAAP